MEITEILGKIIGGLIIVVGILVSIGAGLGIVALPFLLIMSLIDWLKNPIKIKKKDSSYDWRSNGYILFLVWVVIIFFVLFVNEFLCNGPRSSSFDPRGF